MCSPHSDSPALLSPTPGCVGQSAPEGSARIGIVQLKRVVFLRLASRTATRPYPVTCAASNCCCPSAISRRSIAPFVSAFPVGHHPSASSIRVIIELSRLRRLFVNDMLLTIGPLIPKHQTSTAMRSQPNSPLLNHRTGAASAALSSRETMRLSQRPQPLSVAITKLVIQEFFVVLGAAYLASALYHEAMVMEWPSSHLYIAANLFLAVSVESIALGFGHYKNSQSQSRHAFLFSGFGAVALAFSFLLSALFVLKITELYSRVTFVFQFVTVEFAVLAARAFFYSRLQRSIAAGLVNARRVILVGDSTDRIEFANRLKATAIQTVGSFPLPIQHDQNRDVEPPDHTEGELRGLIDGCRRLKPDDILILAKQDTIARLNDLLRSLSEVPAALHVVLVEAAAFLAAAKIVEFGNAVTMQVLRPPLSRLQQAAKRLFDVVVATAGLLVLAPLLTLVAIAIKLDSPGPVLFRQTRHGYNNETIKVFKFRSMKLEDGNEFKQTERNDSRVTRAGAMLRRTNIDELPQLINVLRGEMSIVGPRPHAVAHNEMFEDKISVFSRRHVVKPGITGWAQVNGYRGATSTLEQMQRRVEHDLYYIDNWSFWLDLRIMVMTLFSKSAYTNAY
jgi:Undecaprenyl-phosphate glucose phosphotransferase